MQRVLYGTDLDFDRKAELPTRVTSKKCRPLDFDDKAEVLNKIIQNFLGNIIADTNKSYW